MSFFRASVEIFRAENCLILPMETHFAFAFLLKPTWTRDQYFPLTYAHATWKRLAPFFRLPGRVTLEPRTVSVELRPFNDRHLNHDLVALCERVNQAAPQLPDGRHLLFSVCPLSDRQRCRQARQES